MKTIRRTIVAIIILIILALVGATFIVPYPYVKSEAPDSSGCNWMSYLKNDVLLSDISIPGTHDTCTEYVALGIKTRCQDKSVTEQLYCGARFLDIRLMYDENGSKTVHNFITCHKGSGFGSPKLLLEDVLEECYSFLKNNPRETICFFIKQDFGSKTDELVAEINEKIAENGDFWYTENRIPTLGEVRGKLVLFNRYAESGSALTDKSCGINIASFPIQDAMEYKGLEFAQKSVNGNDIAKVFVQDRYKLSSYDKWNNCVKPLMDEAKEAGKLQISFLSTANGLSPELNANYVNGEFAKYKTDSSKCYGIMLFDFINGDLAKKVYECNQKNLDSSPAVTTASQCPAFEPQHGTPRFMDWLWNLIIQMKTK